MILCYLGISVRLIDLTTDNLRSESKHRPYINLASKTDVLVNRRNALAEQDMVMVEPSARANDPFSGMEHFLTGLDADPEDYEWLEYDTTQTGKG